MPRILRRKHIFFGGEGRSEGAFAAWLQHLCDRAGLALHLDGNPSRGGDTLKVVRDAIKKREQQAKKGSYTVSLILVDEDLISDNHPNARPGLDLAERNRFEVIKLRPCFEGLIVRLHADSERASHPSAQAAKDHLQRLWPDLRSRPPTRDQLQNRFDIEDLRRVACHDPDLARLLELLGLGASGKDGG